MIERSKAKILRNCILLALCTWNLCACVNQQIASQDKWLVFDQANAKSYQFIQNGMFSYGVCGNAKFPCEMQKNDISSYNCLITKQKDIYQTFNGIRVQKFNVQYFNCTRK
jgi:hypothetical protein